MTLFGYPTLSQEILCATQHTFHYPCRQSSFIEDKLYSCLPMPRVSAHGHRRWTRSSADGFGIWPVIIQIEDPSNGIESREDLEKVFATMRSRVAAKERVFCLIDALNQFERMPSARYLTWLPKL
jgi:hypothetical protein